MRKKDGLTIFDFFMIGFGAIIGIGWALYVNSWIARAGGVVPTILGYIAGTLICVPVAMCYAELTPMLRVSGGVVAYGQRAFGPKFSFAGGWMLCVGYTSACMWEALFLCDVTAMIIPGLTSGDPIYTIAGYGIYPATLIIGLVVTLIVMLINLHGATGTAKFQNVLSITLIATAVIAVIVLLTKADFANMQPIYQSIEGYSHTSIWGGILACMMVVPFFMGGIDCIPPGIEDASSNTNYKRLGSAIVFCILAVGLFYVLVIFACGVAVPWLDFVDYATPAAPNIFLSGIYSAGVGKVAYVILLVSVLTGLVTTLNAVFYALSRMYLSMARARLLPAWFGKLHPKYGTPSNAIYFITFTISIGVFLGLGLIDPLTQVISICYLTSWGISCLSVARLRKTEPNLARPYKIPGGAATAWFAGLICAAWAVVGFIPALPSWMGKVGLWVCIVAIVVGIIFYNASSKYRNAVSDEERCKHIFAAMEKK